MINIKIRLFAALKEIIGKNQIELSIPENFVINDVLKILESSYPGIKNILSISKFAVNMEYRDIDTRLAEGDELTIIMPVSGGFSDQPARNENEKYIDRDENILIEIAVEKIDDSRVIDFVSSNMAGSILLFNGTVRDNEDGEPVKFLFYEAYPEMAIKEMRNLINKAFKSYELLKVCIVHRIGKIGIGEISISIGVSSPHREDSYLASKFLIDNIKETVPIWKKESFEGHDKWKRIS